MTNRLALKKLLEVTANEFTLLAPRFQRQLEQVKPKLEKRLKEDTVTRNMNIDNMEKFIQYIEDSPRKANKAKLLQKEYVLWIFDRYLRGGIQSVTDVDKAWENFEVYHAGWSRLPPERRSLNLLRTLHDFDQLVQYMNEQNMNKSKTAEKRAIRSDTIKQYIKERQIKLIYDDNKITVWQPLTHKGSVFLGLGTRWCTAMRDYKNHFRSYTDDGPLYYIFVKGKSEKLQFKKSGESQSQEGVFPKRFALHFESGNIVNSADNQISLKKVAADGRLGSLRRAFNFRPEFNPNVSEPDALAAVKKNPRVIKYIKKPTQKTIYLAYKGSGPHIFEEIDGRLISKELMKKVIDDGPSGPQNVKYFKPVPDDIAIYAIKKNPQVIVTLDKKKPEWVKLACEMEPLLDSVCFLWNEKDDEDDD